MPLNACKTGMYFSLIFAVITSSLIYSLKNRGHVFFYLKELRNYMRKFFLCPPQKLAKTQPTF